MTADSLSLVDAVGQLICPTLYHGHAADRAYDAARESDLLARHGWGGYIVFHDERDALAARLAPLRAIARSPLLIAADMERGAGQHVAGLTTLPPAMAFGATGDPALAEEMGALTAHEALEAGVNWIFAPVADVTNNPANPIINVRSFGGDPALVAAMVAAFVRGCQRHGALACAKHFPGHGDTETDSHTRLGTVAASRARLDAVELPPFRAAIAAGVASIMSAHLALPALDAQDLPATLSKRIMTGLLREEWGYQGLVVTDALVMGGITRTLDPLEAAVRALDAGCDMLLMPPDPVATHQALLAAVTAGRLAEARVYEAAGRVAAAKARLGAVPAGAPPGEPATLARRVARGSLTLAKGRPDMRLPAGTLVLAVDDGAEPGAIAEFARAATARGLDAFHTVGAATGASEWRAIAALAERAEAVLVGVFSPVKVSKDRSLLPEALVAPLAALARACPTTVVSFASPFVPTQLPEAEAWVLAYGADPEQLDAALAALREGTGFPGRLPVTLVK